MRVRRAAHCDARPLSAANPTNPAPPEILQVVNSTREIQRVLLALAMCAVGAHALAQNPLWVTRGTHPNQRFGWGLNSAPDWDGDGLAEVLAFHSRGARLLRGSDGAVLTEYPRAVLALGDLNGDRRSELIAVPDDGWPWPPVSLEVLSGANGSVIATWPWNDPAVVAPGQTRWSLAPLGDVNGDALGDVIAIELGGSPAVLVLSGADGSVLRRHVGSAEAVPLGDVNADGRADYLLEQHNLSGFLTPAQLTSGADGSVLASHPPALGVRPESLGIVRDLDFDGVDDLSRQAQAWPPTWNIYSGASGALLHSLPGRPAGALLGGVRLTLTADVDGDGVREIGFVDHPTETIKLYAHASGAVIQRYDALTRSVLNAGDVDGDGREDVLIGEPLDFEGRGAVLLARAGYDDRIGAKFAFGSSACPCGPGAPEAGCASNLPYPSGASLSAFGSTSLAARDLQFNVQELAGNPSTLLFASSSVLSSPLSSGQGLLALAPPLARLRSLSLFGWTDAPSLPAWNSWSAGQTQHFQVWYRTWPGACAGLHNYTNAISITFTP